MAKTLAGWVSNLLLPPPVGRLETCPTLFRRRNYEEKRDCGSGVRVVGLPGNGLDRAGEEDQVRPDARGLGLQNGRWRDGQRGHLLQRRGGLLRQDFLSQRLFDERQDARRGARTGLGGHAFLD